jgi:hypothetical protein
MQNLLSEQLVFIFSLCQGWDYYSAAKDMILNKTHGLLLKDAFYFAIRLHINIHIHQHYTS